MRLIGLLTLVLALGVPATAHAGLAEVIADPGSPAEVRLTAAPGEINDVTATATGDSWSISDARAPLSAGAGCVQLSPQAVSCANSVLTAYPLVVLAGDRDDTVAVTDAPRSTVYGGGGNDTLRGGRSADQLNGGPGHDRLIGGGGGDELSGGPGNDALEFSARPATLACGSGIDVLTVPRGVPLLSGALPRDCDRVRLGPLLLSTVPQRRGGVLVVQAGCDARTPCNVALTLKLVPARGAAITLGRGSYRIAAGRGAGLGIALGPFSRRLAASRSGRVQVSVIARNGGDAGGPRRTSWRVSLAR